jgi:hypothetical protein
VGGIAILIQLLKPISDVIIDYINTSKWVKCRDE